MKEAGFPEEEFPSLEKTMRQLTAFFSSKSPTVRAGLLIGALVLLAYLPAVGAGYIWDDDAHVTQNEALRSVEGLKNIWFEPGSVQQY